MNKYNEIEVKTAENLLKEGYKWIARDESEGLFAYTDKPSKVDTFWCSDGISNCVCYYVPIFQNVRFEDKEPTSLESIVHPQILDEEEREYLAAVIKPFRGEVKYIFKDYGISGGHSFERVEAKCYCAKIDSTSYLYLPVFKTGTMYKGMETNRKYTLEELGL